MLLTALPGPKGLGKAFAGITYYNQILSKIRRSRGSSFIISRRELSLFTLGDSGNHSFR